MENIRKLSAYDPKSIVKTDGIMYKKEQVCTEYKTSTEWKDKWGFLLEFDKFCLEEARKRGIDEDKYREMANKFYNKKPKTKESFWKKLPVVPPPKTCSGYVGWRSSHPECCLELFGSLYKSPKHTLPPEFPVYTILLE